MLLDLGGNTHLGYCGKLVGYTHLFCSLCLDKQIFTFIFIPHTSGCGFSLYVSFAAAPMFIVSRLANG